MFKNFKENVRELIDEPEIPEFNDQGYDPSKYYYDEEEEVLKEIEPKSKKKKPLYLHIMFAIYQSIMFVIMVNRLIAAGFYWFWSCWKGTADERHSFDHSAQNYLFVTFVVIPIVMYWYNIYL